MRHFLLVTTVSSYSCRAVSFICNSQSHGHHPMWLVLRPLHAMHDASICAYQGLILVRQALEPDQIHCSTLRYLEKGLAMNQARL